VHGDVYVLVSVPVVTSIRWRRCLRRCLRRDPRSILSQAGCPRGDEVARRPPEVFRHGRGPGDQLGAGFAASW